MALATVRLRLESKDSSIDRVIFCTFENADYEIYKIHDVGQSLSVLQIYPNFTQNSESESLARRSKRINSKVYFNVVRDLNVPLGLTNYGESVCFLNSAIQV